MIKISKRIFAAAVFLAFATNAIAGSGYDGSWNLVFSTQRGACDPTYDFVVNISNGIITHPNLLPRYPVLRQVHPWWLRSQRSRRQNNRQPDSNFHFPKPQQTF